MTLRHALPNEADALLSLYQSVKGEEFCVWSDTYPTMKDVLLDLDTENVYVLTENGKILGAVSVEPHNDMDHLTCWKYNDGTHKELARVVVHKDCRGRGLAGRMVELITPILKKKGCNCIRLAAAKKNLPAYKTYQKAGFATVGQEFIFGADYYLMEKEI